MKMPVSRSACLRRPREVALPGVYHSSRSSSRPQRERSGPRRGFRPGRDLLYLAFNKPYAVLSQFTQPEGSNKETLAGFGFPAGVYPVGRLDYDSEGLLLLSDDSSLNNFLLDPRNRHPRSYLAQVEGIPTPDALQRLETGVTIEGKPTLPAQARLLADEPELPPRPVPIRFRQNIPTAWIHLTLTEGRNRQVRRMTAAVGYPTLRLVRVSIGELDLLEMGLAPGEWRRLTPAELKRALQLSEKG